MQIVTIGQCLVIIGVVCTGLGAFAVDAGDVPALEAEGYRFEIGVFENGARAFSNRSYEWRGIPPELEGWSFTRTGGGERARIEVIPGADGIVYIATSLRQSGLDLTGWEHIEGVEFHYTDTGKTAMAVYRRECRAGERTWIPQGCWTGGIVLAPELIKGRTIDPEQSRPPGVVIDKSPNFEKVYIGSPSIAKLDNGDYVVSHDFFGPGTDNDKTAVFGSKNRGKSWRKLTNIDGQWWSTLFVHRDRLYIMGVSKQYGDAVIRRSKDGGETWTTPDSAESGLLLDDGDYHCAPVPVVIHKGRIWRAMEDGRGPGGWGSHFRSFVMSAPVDADLLDASNWVCTNRIEFDPDWFEARNPGWLEGNVVVTPDGELVNILRFNDDRGDRAAIINIGDDGKTASFDPDTGFIDFPGGKAKFTIRYDPASGRYWSLVNKQTNPKAYRNILALTSSDDLRAWRVESIILEHPDSKYHAFQYVDWLFEGDDIIAVSRTAWDGAHRAHDANYMTFHRIESFRELAGNGQ